MKNRDVIAKLNSFGIHKVIMLALALAMFCIAEPSFAASSKKARNAVKTSQKTSKKQPVKKAPSKKARISSKKMIAANAKKLSAQKPSLVTTVTKRGPAGISDSQRELEIRGQSRNLSMMLVLKNRNENIDFVKPRDSYREEIQQTGF